MKLDNSTKKVVFLFGFAFFVGILLFNPFEISASGSDLRQVIKIKDTYNESQIFQDYPISPSLADKSKSFAFITFSHEAELLQAKTARGWEILNDTTLRIYGHGVSNVFTLYKTITINATEVDEDIALYPHLLNITDTDLRDDALASGDDIVFSDNTGTTQLPHEIEFYDSSDGHLVAWIGVPNVSSTVDTTYRMWYSSPLAGDTQVSGGVWDSDFDVVLHLHDDFLDSTINSNDGSSSGTTDVVGHIADGESWDGVDDRIQVSDVDSLDNLSAWTISTWITRATSDTADSGIVMKSGDNDPEWTNSYGMAQVGTTNEICTWADASATEQICFTPPEVFNETYLVATYNGTGLTLYSNGTEITNGNVTATPITNNGDVLIGKGQAGGGGGNSLYVWDGDMDEVRLSGVARSSDYITTTYCDQQGNSICPFDSVGVEVTGETFENMLTESVDLDFVAYIVEYTTDSDMFTQQSNFTITASEAEGERFTKFLTPINTSNAMIVSSGYDHDGEDFGWGTEEYQRIFIQNSTDWGWEVDDTPNTGDQHNFVEIIDWNSTSVRVQNGTFTMVNNVNMTDQVTPPIAVVRNQTILLATYQNQETESAEIRRSMVFATILDNGDLVFNKDDDRGTLLGEWQLVEFLDGSVFVQHNATCDISLISTTCGAQAIPSGTSIFNITVPVTVDLDASVAISTVQSPFGQGTGQNDQGNPKSAIDKGMWTLDLIDGNTVNATRGDGNGIAVLGIQVISWGNVTGTPQTFDKEISDIVTAIDLSQNMNITKVQSDTTSAGDTVSANGVFVVELSDTGEVVDVTSLNITKLNTDTVTALDETNFNISIGLLDTATILDLAETNLFRSVELLDTTNVNDDLQFAITKALTDLSTVLDDPDKDIEKTIADITTIIDQAEPAVIRQILELDTVTASDEVRLEIIKAIIDVVANSDDLNFSLDKILSDTAVVSDLIDSNTDLGENILDQITADDLVILDVTRQLSDVASAFDDLDLVPTKVFLDTTSVSDTVESSKASDVTETDPVVTQDDLIIDVTKLIQDVSTIEDDIVLLRIRDIAINDTVTITDPNIFFNFISAPPTNQTGGGSPSSSSGGGIPSFQRIVGLSIESELFFVGSEESIAPPFALFDPEPVIIGNEVPSDFIISTFGRETLPIQITNIEPDQEFTNWFILGTFPQTVNFGTTVDTTRTVNDPARIQNTGLQDYVLTVPATRCDSVDPFISAVIECVDPIVYEIPLTFTLTKGGSEFKIRHIVTVDASTPVTCDAICELTDFLVVNWYWLAGIVVIFMMLYLFGGKVVGAKGVRTVRRIDRKAFSSFEATPKRKFKRGRR